MSDSSRTRGDPQPPRPRLPGGQQPVAADRWPQVGEREPAPLAAPWRLAIGGRVRQAAGFSLEQLAALPQTTITTDIHCVTRWSKFDMSFSGVLLRDVLDVCPPDPKAAFVSFVAHTERRHSSSLPLDEALELGTLLATRVAGRPLPAEHGGPLRSVVPGKYFYKSVKWVCQIELLEQDRLGYWESEAGYHNGADPWQQQRYIASRIDRRVAARLIESRDFSNRDLLSLNASGRDLSHLLAIDARLRNADFSLATLTLADFTRANLSNASFRHADLQAACFVDADLEGADFAAADLRGADLRGCSLFGATFCDLDTERELIDAAARIDRTTRIESTALQRLTAGQRQFVQQGLGSE